MAFSIKQLLFSISVVAFGVAALVNADQPFVFQLFDLLTLAILIAIAYGAWINQGAQRAYRIGFLCWAALYYWFFKQQFNIGTGDLIDVVTYMTQPIRPSVRYRGDSMPPVDIFGVTARGPNYVWRTAYHSIGHSLFLLFFGLIGGCVTVHFYRKRQRMLDRATQE